MLLGHSAGATPRALAVYEYTYDEAGNRNAVYDTLNSVTYSYHHNVANEYDKVTTGTTLPDDPNYFYDPRGNLSRDDGFDDNADDAFVYDYDAGTLDATSGRGPRTYGPNAKRSSSCQGKTA